MALSEDMNTLVMLTVWMSRGRRPSRRTCQPNRMLEVDVYTGEFANWLGTSAMAIRYCVSIGLVAHILWLPLHIQCHRS